MDRATELAFIEKEVAELHAVIDAAQAKLVVAAKRRDALLPQQTRPGGTVVNVPMAKIKAH